MKKSGSVRLIPATRVHDALLANLLELYIHDFSEFVDIYVGEDGRFGYAHLPEYWSDPGRKAFLVRFGGKWAGFALLLKVENNVWDMAEFFVMRRYRRQGVGTEIAEQVWRGCPGLWQIRVRAENAGARKFWKTSIARFAGEAPKASTHQIDGVTWHIYSFESKRQAKRKSEA